MFRSLLCAVLFLLTVSQAAFSADTVVQTVGLSIDKRLRSYNIDRVLKKVVLSVAVSNKSVNVLSSDSDDLEIAGIGAINGNVLMKTEKKGAFYQVGLYESDPQSGKPDKLFDDTLKLPIAQFSESVDDIALKILDRIALKFPPKPLRELTKIDMIRVKLSEYESPDGFWSLTVSPTYDSLSMYFSLSYSNTPGGSVYKYFNHNGGDLDVEAVYRIQQWTLGFGANGGAGYWSESATIENSSYYDFSIRGIFGYGLFGSLVVIGLEPRFYRAEVTMNGTTLAGTNRINAPNVTSQRLALYTFIQVNISKDYNLSASVGMPIPLLYEMRADFSRSGSDPAYNNLNILPPASIFSSDGMNFKLKFNFRIFSEWWLNLYSETVVAGYNYETGNTIDPNKYFTDAAGQYQVKKIGFSKTRLGLGVRYDF
jgi:hypothetical protein